MEKLESLINLEHIKAEPQSRYSSDIIVAFDKNADKELILKKLGEHNISTEKLGIDKYLLSPTDGQSNDTLRDYVWRYFEKKTAKEKIKY
jgi:hypothetical protein